MTKPLGFRTAARRYMMVFWPLMIAYLAALFAGVFIVDKETSPLYLRAGFAVAVALPLFGILWAMLRQTKETDEYTRLRQLEALAEAGAITTGAVFLVGFLEIFNAIDDVPLFLFGPLFFLAFGLAHCRQRLGKTV
ncbi:hypothetical protein [Hyphomonas sp.]|uniref:hypothetical protein n=1 Tax=Hyphomonas sp. TaxID=87 RepID=UPI00391B551E